MKLKDDIVIQIDTDFAQNAGKATEMLTDAINKTDYLKTDRIIRCIVFLAKGNLTDLNKYIQMAITDTRDVILWAEYEIITEEENPQKVRDFNKTFDKCSCNDYE